MKTLVAPLLALIIVWILSGCGEETRVSTVVAPPPTPAQTEAELAVAKQHAVIERLTSDNGKQAQSLKELDAQIRERESIISAAKADIARLKADRIDMQNAQVAAVLGWTAAGLALAALLCGLAAWLSPIGKKTFLLAAVGCAALATVSLWARAYVAWLPYAGAIIIVLVGLVAIYFWRRQSMGGLTAASQLKLYAAQLEALVPTHKSDLDKISIALQGTGRGLLDDLLKHSPTYSLPIPPPAIQPVAVPQPVAAPIQPV